MRPWLADHRLAHRIFRSYLTNIKRFDGPEAQVPRTGFTLCVRVYIRTSKWRITKTKGKGQPFVRNRECKGGGMAHRLIAVLGVKKDSWNMGHRVIGNSADLFSKNLNSPQ